MPFHVSSTRKATAKTATTAGLYTRKHPPEEQPQQEQQQEQEQEEGVTVGVAPVVAAVVVVVEEVGEAVEGVGDGGAVVAPVQESRVVQEPQVGRRVGRWNIDIRYSLGVARRHRVRSASAMMVPKSQGLIITKILDRFFMGCIRHE